MCTVCCVYIAVRRSQFILLFCLVVFLDSDSGSSSGSDSDGAKASVPADTTKVDSKIMES